MPSPSWIDATLCPIPSADRVVTPRRAIQSDRGSRRKWTERSGLIEGGAHQADREHDAEQQRGGGRKYHDALGCDGVVEDIRHGIMPHTAGQAFFLPILRVVHRDGHCFCLIFQACELGQCKRGMVRLFAEVLANNFPEVKLLHERAGVRVVGVDPRFDDANLLVRRRAGKIGFKF